MAGTLSYGGSLPGHLAPTLTTIQWSDSTLPLLVAESSEPPAHQGQIFETGHILDGRYEVRRVLGSGGMGQVFEARDLGLNRMVAIKVAWPDVGAAPLGREAQILAAFRHPGLPIVHELNRADGHDFLVMERLSGTTLADMLARQAKRLPLDEVLMILDGICDALGPLHANGLAHADLKPANIMVLPGGRIVLLDFGIARIEQLIVGAKRISGSPHYMAPEAVKGNVQPGAAHLVDLYALGVIAFVLLTGDPPFDHPNPVELMLLHLGQPAPPVEAKRADVPKALAGLVGQLLAKQAADRPPGIDLAQIELRRVRLSLGGDGR